MSEAQSVTKINFSKCEKFTSFPILPSNIGTIICSYTPIFAKADLSPYTKLTQLQADSCDLTDLNAAMCPNLEKLDLNDNHIMGLDLSAQHRLSSQSADVKMRQDIERSMGGLVFRGIGIIRAKANVAMTNLTYNIARTAQIFKYHRNWITA